MQGKKTALFFIPEAGIRPFMRALCVFGAALQNQDYKVLFTRCTGEMVRCPMYPNMHKPLADISSEEKAIMCKICDDTFRSAQDYYGFDSVPLKDMITPEILKSIDGIIDNETSLEETEYDGFPVGKVAQYDFGLERKQLYNKGLDQDNRDLFIAYIKNTALSIALCNRIYEAYMPSVFISFNIYAQCQGVRFVATKNKAVNIHLHYPSFLGFDGSLFEIYKTFILYHLLQNWNAVKDMPISEKYVMASWDDAIYRGYQEGSHIYSCSKSDNPIDLVEKFKLDINRKTFIAYTTSEDESLGGKTVLDVWKDDTNRISAFSTQIEWLKFLRAYVKTRSDIQIIVRIHPREGKNKNYSFGSYHLELLKSEFNYNEENFIVVWPEDPISSYDLFELADGVLIRSSSIGLEACRVGIPVLSYIRNHYYQDDGFTLVGSTVEEYKKKLDMMILSGYSFKDLVKAIRYNYMRVFLPCIDLSETVPKDVFDNSWPLPPKDKEPIIAAIVSNNIDIFDYNKKNWEKSLSKDAESIEKEAVKKGIRIFIDKIFYPPNQAKNKRLNISYILAYVWNKCSRKSMTDKKSINCSSIDYSLRYSENVSKLPEFIKITKKDKRIRIVIKDGMYAILVHNGRCIKRMSRMVIRLAKLHDQC